MLKRAAIFLGIGFGLLLVVVLALPWWWGSVLRWQGERVGLSFTAYEAVGYGRWAVADLRVEQAGFTGKMARLEAPHPLLWWWRRAEASPVHIEQLQLAITASPDEAESTAEPLTRRQLVAWFHEFEPYVPAWAIQRGRVSWGDEKSLAFDRLAWTSGALRAEELTYADHTADVVLAVPGSTEIAGDAGDASLWRLNAAAAPGEWSLAGTLGGALDTLSLEGQWRDQPFLLDAVWPSEGWEPSSARLETPVRWTLPAAPLGLGATHDSISGQVEMKWHEGAFTVSTTWAGQARETEETALPFGVRLEASGDRSRLRLEEIDLTLPGLALGLSEPIEIAYRSLDERLSSEFRIEANLAELPGVDGTGTIAGVAEITTRKDGWPLVEFTLQGEQVAWRNYAADRVVAAGEVTWPNWVLTDVQVTDPHGGRIELFGSGEAGRITAGEWAVQFSSASVKAHGPLAGEFGQLKARGTIAGEGPEWRHTGSVQVSEVTWPEFQAVDLTGTWQGTGRQAEGEVRIESESGQLRVAGAWSGKAAELRLVLESADDVVVETATPFRVEGTDGWELTDLNLAGPGIQLSADRLGLSAGELRLQVDSPSWAWLADWWETPPEVPWQGHLAADVAWTPEALTGTVKGNGEIALTEEIGVQLDAAVSSQGRSLEIAESRVAWRGTEVATLRGRLPVSFRPQPPYWQVDPAGELDIQAALARSPELWAALNRSTRLKVANPEFDLRLGGTWQRPQGEGRLTIERVEIQPDGMEDSAWPIISAVKARLTDDGDGLVLDPVTARLDGQEVTLRGHVPFTPSAWTELSADPLAYFRNRGRGELSVPRAELAALTKFVPDYLVPTGTVEIALSYAPGRGLNGRIELEGAVSRPLGPLGVLQEIEADLRFENREMAVRKVGALMGGQPVTLTGSAHWPEAGEVELDLALRGTNLPLIRTTGVLLRSDLDLQLESDASGEGRVSGLARLRDGLILADVRSLVPRGGGVAVPARRPPYFSITVPPLNQWQLAVELAGENFLRLRTPVVTGVGSLRAELVGTLETPRLLGEMELREASLRLPFVRMEIDDARVRLTEADPYDPEIFLQASGQRIGYDLSLELAGKASDPRLTLQSSPALSAEAVLLMVMAGVTPNDGNAILSSDRAVRLGMYLSQGVVGQLLGTDERERLTVTTGEQLSRLGKETYGFEYELADRWSIVGEYDEFDYYNAAVKWRLRPGKTKPEPSPDDGEEAEND